MCVSSFILLLSNSLLAYLFLWFFYLLKIYYNFLFRRRITLHIMFYGRAPFWRRRKIIVVLILYYVYLCCTWNCLANCTYVRLTGLLTHTIRIYTSLKSIFFRKWLTITIYFLPFYLLYILITCLSYLFKYFNMDVLTSHHFIMYYCVYI